MKLVPFLNDKKITPEWVKDTFNVDWDEELGAKVDDVVPFAEALHERIVGNYFGSGAWQTDMIYPYSGWSLVDEVNALTPKNVLDVGCGYNQFKHKIRNLVGIDPYNSRADYNISILDFAGPQYDVVMCLGSINFGTPTKLKAELDKVWQHTRGGGYQFWRVNPGLQHPPSSTHDDFHKWIDFYDWHQDIIFDYCRDYDMQLMRFETEYNRWGAERLFFKLRKM